MSNNSARLSFNYYGAEDTDYERDISLDFSVDPDMNIYVLHDLCRRFAMAYGFSEVSVDKVFGEVNYDEIF